MHLISPAIVMGELSCSNNFQILHQPRLLVLFLFLFSHAIQTQLGAMFYSLFITVGRLKELSSGPLLVPLAEERRWKVSHQPFRACPHMTHWPEPVSWLPSTTKGLGNTSTCTQQVESWKDGASSSKDNHNFSHKNC